MKKFVKLSVLNSAWCDALVTVEDIKQRMLWHRCVLCQKYVCKAYAYKGQNFCVSCLTSRAQNTKGKKSLARIAADYINLVLHADTFRAKTVAFRKSDILSVEGAAYDHSIIRFNSGTVYASKDHVRVTERKNTVMRLLGETLCSKKDL